VGVETYSDASNVFSGGQDPTPGSTRVRSAERLCSSFIGVFICVICVTFVGVCLIVRVCVSVCLRFFYVLITGLAA